MNRTIGLNLGDCAPETEARVVLLNTLYVLREEPQDLKLPRRRRYSTQSGRD